MVKLSEDSWAFLRAVAAGCGIVSIPEQVYDECHGEGLIEPSPPVIPCVRLTKKGRTLMGRHGYDAMLSSITHHADGSRKAG
jgi:hypothetical protein